MILQFLVTSFKKKENVLSSAIIKHVSRYSQFTIFDVSQLFHTVFENCIFRLHSISQFTSLHISHVTGTVTTSSFETLIFESLTWVLSTQDFLYLVHTCFLRVNFNWAPISKLSRMLQSQ